MGCALGLWVGVVRPVAPEVGAGGPSVFLKARRGAVVASHLQNVSVKE